LASLLDPDFRCRYTVLLCNPTFNFYASLLHVVTMRLTNFALAAVAAAPTFVSAGGQMGFALGTKKPDGSCKSQQDYVRLMLLHI
jgi:exo-beta-1,3-glucanase (GH17 family)